LQGHLDTFFNNLFNKRSDEMEEDTASPDTPSKPGIDDKPANIRSVNRKPILIAGSISVAILACVMMFQPNSNAAKTLRAEDKTAPQAAADLSDSEPDFIKEKKPEATFQNPEASPADTVTSPNPANTSQVPPIDGAQVSATPPPAPQQVSPQDIERQRIASIREARQQSVQGAINSDLVAFSGSRQGLLDTQTQIQKANQEESKDNKLSDLQGDNITTSKPELTNYLLHTRSQAISKYEVKAGTVIPSVMIGGINSELPGTIIAQVTQNVFDTRTGNYLLIPFGSKLVGEYDHQVVNGQKRVLVIWNRVIYPDTTSLTLEGMSGVDQSGYAGFHDKVNTHILPAIGNALVMSVITAGAQLSQPRAKQGDYSYSAPQIASAALGQQMNQLGAMTYQRGLNAIPTIMIRPGYQFNVMVQKDIILPTWRS